MSESILYRCVVSRNETGTRRLVQSGRVCSFECQMSVRCLDVNRNTCVRVAGCVRVRRRMTAMGLKQLLYTENVIPAVCRYRRDSNVYIWENKHRPGTALQGEYGLFDYAS